MSMGGVLGEGWVLWNVHGGGNVPGGAPPGFGAACSPLLLVAPVAAGPPSAAVGEMQFRNAGGPGSAGGAGAEPGLP